jgi:hypothetical protein
MRTIDQMCFSSQFYMMSTLHTMGLISVVFAVEIMVRKEYNMFGDPALLAILPFVVASCYFAQRLCIWTADQLGLWRLKHEGTAWHTKIGDDEDEGPKWDDLDKIKGASHEAFLLNQKINSESFRFRFLEYNRPWLVAQLPTILTPRTLRRARPYLIAQFTKILGSVNPDISDDDEDDDDDMPKFGPVVLSSASRNMIRLWLAQARRRRALRDVVQPLINRARKNACEVCLNRKQLQVDLITALEVLGDRFEEEHPSDEFDQVAWKNYFQKNARFRTLCLQCVQREKEDQKLVAQGMQAGAAESDRDVPQESVFGPVFLSAASRAIMLRWYRAAQDQARKAGRPAGKAHISDDDEEDDNFDDGTTVLRHRVNLSAASRAMMVKWVAMARERVVEKSKDRLAKKFMR